MAANESEFSPGLTGTRPSVGYRAFHYAMLAVSAGALIVAAIYIGRGLVTRFGPDSRAGTVRLIADNSPVAGATSLLARSKTGVHFSFATSGLPVGHMVTLRAEIFNRPQACQHRTAATRCGAEDLTMPGVQPSVVFLDAQLVRSTGRASFAGDISANDADQAALGRGLTDPHGAEIHLVLLDHGDALAGSFSEQFSTLTGGCSQSPQNFGTPGPLTCRDLQYVVH